MKIFARKLIRVEVMKQIVILIMIVKMEFFVGIEIVHLHVALTLKLIAVAVLHI